MWELPGRTAGNVACPPVRTLVASANDADHELCVGIVKGGAALQSHLNFETTDNSAEYQSRLTVAVIPPRM